MILVCNNFLKWQTAGTFWTPEIINEGWNRCDRVTSKKYWRHKVRVSSLHRTCSLRAIWSRQLVLGCGITSLYSTVIAGIILPLAPSWRSSSGLCKNDDHIEKTSVAYTQPLRRKEWREETEEPIWAETAQSTQTREASLLFPLWSSWSAAPLRRFLSVLPLSGFWTGSQLGWLGWVSRAAIRKHRLLGGLSNEMYPLTVWRPEVQDQGRSRVGFFSGYEKGSGPGPSACL